MGKRLLSGSALKIAARPASFSIVPPHLCRLSQIGPALRPLLFRAPEPGQPGQHLPRLL